MASPEQDYCRFRDRGDVQALAAVFDALAPELLLVAAHLARDGTAAEDLVQATFVDAITKATQWDARRPLLPWLLGILTNHARVRHRRGRREQGAPVPEEATSRTPIVEAEQREVGEAIAHGLRGVPSPLRQALLLRLVHELTPTQIARALACPVATVKTRLRRGLQALRRLLPRGLAGGVAVGKDPRSGLAAVRLHVVARAEQHARFVRRTLRFGAAAAVAAGVASKQLLTAASVLALAALLLVTLLRPENEPSPVARGDGAEPVQAALDATHAEGRGAPVSRIEATPAAIGGVAKAGADFEFVWEGTGLPARHLQVWWQEVDGLPLHRCFADADGRLSLRELPAGDLEVHNFTFRHRWPARAGVVACIRLEVRPGHVVPGTVVDPAGRGIQGARVFAQAFDVGEDARPRLVATTADDGSFVARTDRTGSLWAVAAGHAASDCEKVNASGVASPLRLVVQPTSGVLAGCVCRSGGGPAGGARLTIVRTDGHEALAAPVVLQADGAGRFLTRELACGRHLVVAELAEHAPAPRLVAVAAGQSTQLRIELGRGATLQGTVHASDQAPVRAILWVRLALPDSAADDLRVLPTIRRAFERTGWSGADGSYRIEGLPGGPVAIEAASAATARVHRTLELQEGERRDCNLVLPRGQTVTGRVLTLDGAPRAGWNVSVYGSSSLAQCGVTDASGTFEVHGVDVDRCHVVARDSGERSGLPVHLADVAVDGTELQLRAHPTTDAGHLTGTLVLRPGSRDSDWALRVRPRGFPECLSGVYQLCAAGPFRIGPLAPGSYDVALACGDHVGAFAPIEVLPARVTDLGAMSMDLPVRR